MNAKEGFVALVGVHMLAELMDERKLRQVLDSIPLLDQWREVRQIITREISRRSQPLPQPRPVRVDGPAEDAA